MNLRPWANEQILWIKNRNDWKCLQTCRTQTVALNWQVQQCPAWTVCCFMNASETSYFRQNFCFLGRWKFEKNSFFFFFYPSSGSFREGKKDIRDRPSCDVVWVYIMIFITAHVTVSQKKGDNLWKLTFWVAYRSWKLTHNRPKRLRTKKQKN